jgi:peptidoglycan/LPS O-acetylase OafA/YrhL
MKKRFDIQYLRAIAVIAVICFHSFPNIFSRGYLGVDIFFLLSGYLIFPQLLSAISTDDSRSVKSNLKNFMIRRVTRIAPALGFSVSIFLIAGLLFLPPGADYQIKQYLQAFGALIGMGNLIALKQSGDYFNSDFPFVHYWTLGVEIQVYILATVLFYFLHLLLRKRTYVRNTIRAYRILLIGLILISFVFRIITLNYSIIFEKIGLSTFAISPSSVDFYSTSNRIWEFALGGLIAINRGKKYDAVRKFTDLMYFKNWYLAAILILLFMPTQFLDSVGTTILVVAFSSLYLLCPQRMQVMNMCSKGMVWLGDRSYSIYLLHLPLLTFFAGSFIPFYLRPYLTILGILFTFVLANFSYNYVEIRFWHQDGIIISDSSNTRKGKSGLITVSYFLPTMILLTLFVTTNWTSPKKAHDSYWKEHYAASERSKCPLGQLNFSCELTSNTSENRWLLVGDSHAGAIQQIISEVAQAQNASLEVWNKCRFFNPKISNRLNSYFPDWCIDQNLQRMKRINSRSVDFLLVSYFDSEVRYGDKILPAALWENVFVKTLQRLEVPHILLFSQLPSYKDATGDRPRISFPVELDVARRNIATLELGSRNREKRIAFNAKVDFLDLIPIYCNNSVCHKKLTNFLYVDGNHLSVAGANLIGPSLERYISDKLS